MLCIWFLIGITQILQTPIQFMSNIIWMGLISFQFIRRGTIWFLMNLDSAELFGFGSPLYPSSGVMILAWLGSECQSLGLFSGPVASEHESGLVYYLKVQPLAGKLNWLFSKLDTDFCIFWKLSCLNYS